MELHTQAHKNSGKDVAAALGVCPETGLSTRGVLRMREKFGANELTRAKSKSLFIKLLHSLAEPMMLILLFAFAITLTVNLIKVSRGEPFDWPECVGIFAAIALSVSIALFMERRSEKAFAALNKIGGNISVKILRGGSVCKIPASELVVGDIIKLEVGDKIPVDCRLIAANNLEVDESPLTGESMPVGKNAQIVFSAHENPYLAERLNMVYGGCFVTAGQASAIVTAVGDQTEIGAIAKELKDTGTQQTPLQQKLNRLGKIIAIFGALAAAAVFAIQLIRLFVAGEASFQSVQEIFITSIVLIVAAVPEGLPTIVAVSLALNVIKMAKQNALVKKMSACETVGNVSIICSDKTGTLTENKMTLEFVCTPHGGRFSPDKIAAPQIIKNALLNSTADVAFNPLSKAFDFIGSPTECAMLAAYQRAKPAVSYTQVRAAAEAVCVYPFSGEYKRMTSVIREGGRLTVYTKGAPEIILNLCEMDAAKKKRLLEEIALFQAQAKRVIAFAHGAAHSCAAFQRACAEQSLVFDGYAVISDPIRADVFAAAAECKRAGVKIKMLTGDNAVTAAAIARQLNIIGDTNAGVVTAHDIENMSDEELALRIGGIRVVARSTPATKLRIVKILKALGETVAVTGDGVNDAPAVKNADVGIAMGIAGTEVCREAADIVVLNDSFATVVTSIKWGRGIYENFQRFILFQLTVNLAAVLVTVACVLCGMGAPFTALQLLWINIIMDGPPALTLGLEPIYEGLMDKTPVSRKEHIVTRMMAARICVNAVFIAGLLFFQSAFNFIGIAPQKERTFIFTLFVMMQLFNAFNARELGRRSIFTSFSRNRIMLVVMLVTFCLQIIIVQTGGAAFNTVPLSFYEWIIVFLIGFSMIAFNEIYKLIYARVNRSLHLKKLSARQRRQ